MILRLTSAWLISAAMAFAAPPGVPECFKVHALVKMDQDHYWADWSNACPYTIDSVYVAVRFADPAGRNLGDGVWSLHFLPPGTHRVTRFSTPGSIADYHSVHVHKITSSADEALLHLVPDPGATKMERPELIADPGNTPRPAITLSAEDHNRRGREYIQSKEYRAAIVELTEAIREDPNSSPAYNARGFALYMSHDYRAALEDLDEAIRLNPKYLNAYQNRRQVRKAAGDPAGSASDAGIIRDLLRNSR